MKHLSLEIKTRSRTIHLRMCVHAAVESSLSFPFLRDLCFLGRQLLLLADKKQEQAKPGVL